MNTHSIDLIRYCARSRGNSTIYLGTAGSHGNEQLQVTLGKGWEGLTVQVVFHPCKVAVQLPANGVLDVPWEATARPLTALQGRIVFQGFDQDRLVNSTDLAYTVASHSPALGRDEEPYTPGIVEGVLNQMAADKDAILQAAQQTGQAKEAAAASAAAAASSAANAQQSAGAANTSAGQAAASASQAAGSAAAANETLTQVQTAGQEAQQKVKDAETEALGNIAAAAPALPAVSAAAAWQSVTVKPDGTGYNLAALAPIEATIRPTVTGNPAVCEDSAAWAFQGLAIYGKSTQDGTPSPETPVPIVSAGADGSIDLAVSNGASLLQSMTISTPNGLPGIPVDSGGNYTDASGQQWISDKITESKKIHFLRYLDNSNYDTMIFNTAFSNDSVSICYIPPLYGIVKKFHAAIMSNMFIQGGHGGALLTVGEMSLEANGSVYFGLPPTVKSSLDAQNYMKTNSVKVLVQLAGPTETSLSVEELAAYRALTTYNGTTVVSTAEPVAGIEASYVMDGNKYRESVDKRLAALEAAQTGI